MLFRQLEYFVAVARERHFARAAEVCFVSQPALSAAIAKLEQELNVTLINRGHSFEGLTPEGERLVVWAKRILAEHDAFKAEALAVQSGLTGTLRLGVGPTISTTVSLPVEAFCDAHPLAKVRITTRLTAPEIHRGLRDFELDAGIGYLPPQDEEGLHVRPLYEERYVLIAPPGLLSGEPVTMGWAEAAQLPLALLPSDVRIRRIIDDAFAENGVEISPQVETDSIASLHAHVATGKWASIVPHTWLRDLSTTGKARKIDLVGPVLSAPIVIAVNAAEPGSAIARAFLEAAAGLSLTEVFEKLPSTSQQ